MLSSKANNDHHHQFIEWELDAVPKRQSPVTHMKQDASNHHATSQHTPIIPSVTSPITPSVTLPDESQQSFDQYWVEAIDRWVQADFIDVEVDLAEAHRNGFGKVAHDAPCRPYTATHQPSAPVRSAGRTDSAVTSHEHTSWTHSGHQAVHEHTALTYADHQVVGA